MDEDPKKSSIRWDDDDDVATDAPPLTTPNAPADPPAAASASPDAMLPQLAPDALPKEEVKRSFIRPPTIELRKRAAENTWDDKDDEPFERQDARKMGIIGGKGVGKSYLFQAMVYRVYSGVQSGALTYYLERGSIHLFEAAGETASPGQAPSLTKTGMARSLNRVTFIRKYQDWQRLAFTDKVKQKWYRLRLNFRTGWLGRQQKAVDVEFFEGSGEGFFELATVSPEDRALWNKAYSSARVMVFCLPLWAAFPGPDLTDKDWNEREELIEGFEQVLENYRDMRRRNNQTETVTSILALTMADDRRSALRTLYDRWISPYLEAPQTYLRQLRSGGGIAHYLNNARKVSEALHEEFAASRDPRISAIPLDLDFGGKPWIIPMSAIDGSRLDDLQARYANPDDPARLREARNVAPVPVHVELPLLVALCEHENALM